MKKEKEEKKEKGNILKKILHIIFSIVYTLIIITCILLIAVIFMQKITDSNKSIGGYRLFRVISGSMIPKFDIGEVVLCKDTNIQEIKVGDAIVYRGNYGELKDKIIMHEVVGIKKNENNETIISAKGIKNNEIDPDIKEDQVYGTVKYKSVTLTLLYKLATKKETSFVIIMILVINVFISFKSDNEEKILAKMEKEAEKERKKEEKKKEKAKKKSLKETEKKEKNSVKVKGFKIEKEEKIIEEGTEKEKIKETEEIEEEKETEENKK